MGTCSQAQDLTLGKTWEPCYQAANNWCLSETWRKQWPTFSEVGLLGLYGAGEERDKNAPRSWHKRVNIQADISPFWVCLACVRECVCMSVHGVCVCGVCMCEIECVCMSVCERVCVCVWECVRVYNLVLNLHSPVLWMDCDLSMWVFALLAGGHTTTKHSTSPLTRRGFVMGLHMDGAKHLKLG